MKFKRRLIVAALASLLVFLIPQTTEAQFGNTINGFIFGSGRQPLPDVNVELLDEFSRTLSRVRSNASGRYSFSRISSGRFRVRVISNGEYEDQEQDIEIQNFTSTDSSGSSRTGGYDSVQRDFYLRPRKTAESLGKPGSVFIQNVPEEARATFAAALKSLDNNDTDKGLKGLKLAIEQFPDYYNALELLGNEYIKIKRFVPAQLLLARAVQINPRGYKAWYGLAYSLYSLDVIPDAVESAETAFKIDPNSVEAATLAGVLLRRAKRFDEAATRLQQANALAKGSVAEVHWHLALLYNNDLKRYRDAVKELELYLKTAPAAANRENVKNLIKEITAKAEAAKQ